MPLFTHGGWCPSGLETDAGGNCNLKKWSIYYHEHRVVLVALSSPNRTWQGPVNILILNITRPKLLIGVNLIGTLAEKVSWQKKKKIHFNLSTLQPPILDNTNNGNYNNHHVGTCRRSTLHLLFHLIPTSFLLKRYYCQS